MKAIFGIAHLRDIYKMHYIDAPATADHPKAGCVRDMCGGHAAFTDRTDCGHRAHSQAVITASECMT